ncbi:MAG: DUF1573 domain-containing protein [Bacteroidota bacterium]
MKKWFSSLMVVAVALTFVSCQTSGSAESTAVNSQPEAKPAPAPVQTPPETKKPDFQAEAEDLAKTTVEWNSNEYNYGAVPTGTTVTHQFRFKNTGSEPLTLTRVKASCGCTTPSYSNEPVAPGDEGFIDVAFNTTGKSGRQTKTVTVTGNFDGSITKVLRITGEVQAATAK